MSTINEITKKVDKLPALPEVVRRLIELTSDNESDMNEILGLIEKDISLTTQLLRICNSSYYGFSKQVSSLRQAVVMLGFKAVSKIVISIGPSVYFQKDVAVYGVSSRDLWQHSVGTAFACELLARRFHPEKEQAAYTAGLLHDIGKLVLGEYVKNDLEKVLMEMVESGDSFVEAEQSVLGADHGLVGGKIVRKWKFPLGLVEAIKYHHDPQYATVDTELCELTHMGNIIANGISRETAIDSFANRQSRKIMSRYELDDETLEEIMLEAREYIDEAAKIFMEMETT